MNTIRFISYFMIFDGKKLYIQNLINNLIVLCENKCSQRFLVRANFFCGRNFHLHRISSQCGGENMRNFYIAQLRLNLPIYQKKSRTLNLLRGLYVSSTKHRSFFL